MPANPNPTRRSSGDTFNRERYHKLRLAVALAVLAALSLFGVARFVFSIAPSKAIPVSDSLRAGDFFVTLVRSQEAYVPSLHRDPSKDRFRLYLFVCQADGSPGNRLVEIGGEYRVSEIELSRILGYDGRFVWCFADQLVGIDPSNGKSVHTEDLQRANPSLAEDWQDPRRLVFNDRLRVSSPDRQSAFEVDPRSLKALPVEPRLPASSFSMGPKLEDFLSVGARPAATEWLALLSPDQVTHEHKTGSRLSPINRFESSKEPRQFHRAALGPELDRGSREILEMGAVSEEAFINAAFVRSGPNQDPIRLSEPESFLVAYTSQPGLGGTLVVARVTASGQILWKTDTGLDRFRLRQILPDVRLPAFVGPPLPVPNQVTQPILAIVDSQTGALTKVRLHR